VKELKEELVNYHHVRMDSLKGMRKVHLVEELVRDEWINKNYQIE
jgi:hypothetical protein